MLSLEQQLTLSLNMIIAAALSAVIGYDREQSSHPAGLRTHMLIGLGSALFTTLSIYSFNQDGTDTSRVAAHIVVGVGFLGAGSIVQNRKNSIFGMTTAAGVWVVAAIGMACGTGSYILAVVATFLTWFTLSVVERIKDTGDKSHDDQINTAAQA